MWMPGWWHDDWGCRADMEFNTVTFMNSVGTKLVRKFWELLSGELIYVLKGERWFWGCDVILKCCEELLDTAFCKRGSTKLKRTWEFTLGIARGGVKRVRSWALLRILVLLIVSYNRLHCAQRIERHKSTPVHVVDVGVETESFQTRECKILLRVAYFRVHSIF